MFVLHPGVLLLLLLLPGLAFGGYVKESGVGLSDSGSVSLSYVVLPEIPKRGEAVASSMEAELLTGVHLQFDLGVDLSKKVLETVRAAGSFGMNDVHIFFGEDGQLLREDVSLQEQGISASTVLHVFIARGPPLVYDGIADVRLLRNSATGTVWAVVDSTRSRHEVGSSYSFELLNFRWDSVVEDVDGRECSQYVVGAPLQFSASMGPEVILDRAVPVSVETGYQFHHPFAFGVDSSVSMWVMTLDTIRNPSMQSLFYTTPLSSGFLSPALMVSGGRFFFGSCTQEAGRSESVDISGVATRASFLANEWHHLVLSFSAASKTLTLYCNGARVGSITLSETGSVGNATRALIVGKKSLISPLTGWLLDGIVMEEGSAWDALRVEREFLHKRHEEAPPNWLMQAFAAGAGASSLFRFGVAAVSPGISSAWRRESLDALLSSFSGSSSSSSLSLGSSSASSVSSSVSSSSSSSTLKPISSMASSMYNSGYAAQYAMDGDASTEWKAGSDDERPWIMFVVGEEMQKCEMTLSWNLCPEGFTVFTSSRGGGPWKEVLSVAKDADVAGRVDRVELQISSRVNVSIDSVGQWTSTSLREVTFECAFVPKLKETMQWELSKSAYNLAVLQGSGEDALAHVALAHRMLGSGSPRMEDFGVDSELAPISGLQWEPRCEAAVGLYAVAAAAAVGPEHAPKHPKPLEHVYLDSATSDQLDAEMEDGGGMGEFYRAAAEGGDVGAMNWIAGRHYHGLNGFPMDHGAAAEWFQRAADAGDAEAAYNRGVMQLHGQGEPGGAPNVDGAMANFEFAAENDFPLALNGLGIQLMTENPAKAAALFERSARAGSADGHYNLASLSSVSGIQRLVHYAMAAELGQHRAQYVLGLAYADRNSPLLESFVPNNDDKKEGPSGEPLSRQTWNVTEVEIFEDFVRVGETEYPLRYDCAMALTLLKPLAETNGHDVVQDALSAWLEEDSSEAERLYLMASEMGIASAQANAAFVLSSLDVSSETKKLALWKAAQAASAGDIISHLKLVDMIEEEQPEVALAMLRSAAARGYTRMNGKGYVEGAAKALMQLAMKESDDKRKLELVKNAIDAADNIQDKIASRLLYFFYAYLL
eukprot:g3178.t1